MLTPEQKALRFLRSQLRRMWFYYSPVRKEALNACKVKVQLDGKTRTLHECPDCKNYFATKEMQVDHVVPLGHLSFALATLWIDRLMNGEQIALCKQCHRRKGMKK